MVLLAEPLTPPKPAKTTDTPPPALRQAEWEKAYKNDFKENSRLFQRSLYQTDKLPAHIKTAIKDIQEMEDFSDKLDSVHATVKSQIQTTEEARDEILKFAEAMNTPKGDCDNFAISFLGMSANSGIPGENLRMQYGTVNYSINGKNIFNQAQGHAYMLADIEGKLMLLDNNLDTPIEVTRNEDGTMTGQGTYNGLPIKINIEKVYCEFYAAKHPGKIFEVPPAPDEFMTEKKMPAVEPACTPVAPSV